MSPAKPTASPNRLPARIAATDAYIANAAPFAQPILNHLRELIHTAAPCVTEQIKWSRPFFVYQGVILGNISAFKHHCSFGLWGREIASTIAASLATDGTSSNDGMGSFGKLTSIDDLPTRAKLLAYIREAAQAIASGQRTVAWSRPRSSVAKPEAQVPEALTAALADNPAAAKAFAALTPSCRREYCAWIAEAKRTETRDRRIATALPWIAEGKNRNWQYERA
jgi:uncharacterized protein YdeI (YjbR/CyaY-like superfamily)